MCAYTSLTTYPCVLVLVSIVRDFVSEMVAYYVLSLISCLFNLDTNLWSGLVLCGVLVWSVFVFVGFTCVFVHSSLII